MPISTETKDRIKFIDDGDEAISGNVRDLQAQLWKKVNAFIGQLSVEEGKISNKAGNYSLLAQLKSIEKDLRSGPKKKLIADITKNLIKQQGLIKRYFTDVVKLDVAQVSKKVQANLLNRIGYDGKGFVSRGVLRDLWEDDAEIRSIKAQTVKAIASGRSYKDFQKEMGDLINGTDEREGLTEAHFRTATLDIYNQNDRAITKQYADELELEWFIFQGGLMKSTRDFCRARNNRVFNRKQIEAWTNLTFDGKPAVYNPFMDVGGYNCRHVLDPISDEMKAELMKESPEMFKDPDAPESTPPAPPQTKPKPAPKPATKPAPAPEPIPKPEPEPIPEPKPVAIKPEVKPDAVKPPAQTVVSNDPEFKKRLDVERENGITRTGRKIDVASINGKPLNIVEKVIRDQAFESGALYDTNGKMMFFKNGKSGSVGFTNDEVLYFKGNILTHNHPGSASFSDADINVLTKYGLKEIRAVSTEWDYVMKTTPKSAFYDQRSVRDALNDIRDEVGKKYSAILKEKIILTKEKNAEIRKEFPVYADYKKEFDRLRKLDEPWYKWSYHESSNEAMQLVAERLDLIYSRVPRYGKK